ncbi:putative colanic acid biosynthesis acetyltransferase WcaF [Loktanella sp. DSM 29012]|uniref:hypothetical protein n=1 Tax=Loktanella sp. DSM 29012 TaxID=1881056 RepID=UPI0008D7A6CF|nr:hypothetical protein [Loktanella sp. DSM 29012]SEQ78591.1 putative colanic acid biosynthesis acetyltransferase WcaF [Loktanella sp. DSM 29012]
MKTRPIAKLDLASFVRPQIPGQPGRVTLALWYLVNALVLRGAVLGLLPSGAKAALLRVFGARIGRGVVLKPRIDIKSPWWLEVGDNVWIGERVWIDNHTTVRIGSDSCISQGAYVFTGNHDWTDPGFAFFCRPVDIGAGVWVTAFARIPPGSVVPDHTAVLAD